MTDSTHDECLVYEAHQQNVDLVSVFYTFLLLRFSENHLHIYVSASQRVLQKHKIRKKVSRLGHMFSDFLVFFFWQSFLVSRGFQVERPTETELPDY